MQRSFLTFFHRFVREESGMTLPMIALSFLGMVGLVGSTTDVARLQLVQSKLSFSLDAAGLAAGATLNTTDLETEVGKYMNVNFPVGYLGATTPTITITAVDNGKIINLDSTTTVPTTFMKVFGISTLTARAHSQITRTTSGLELVMVLDNTGSMSGSKLTALKSAATSLVNILYGGQSTVANLWIGMVPFSQAVNIGTEHAAWMDAAYGATLDWGPTTWGGCVEARESNYATHEPNSGLDITDDPPNILQPNSFFRHYYYHSTGLSTYVSSNGNTYNRPSSVTSNNWKYLNGLGQVTYSGPYNTTSKGPNLYCPQKVTPMTADKTTVLNAINSMQALGNTLIPMGMSWGWRMISPRWRGFWGGTMDANGLPLDYGTPHMNKAVILLTDGENTITTNAHGGYGYLQEKRTGTTNASQAITNLNTKTLNICNAMKAQNIYVYTIALGTGTTTTVKTMLKSCATAPNYFFDSPSTATLQGVFQAIGDSLSNLRVSQ